MRTQGAVTATRQPTRAVSGAVTTVATSENRFITTTYQVVRR